MRSRRGFAGHSQYSATSHVPLIKSPSLRVPPPVELAPDIHPLPESVVAYFVYPFTLEPHILTLESSRRSTLAAHASRREAYLRAREDEKERRKREALRRVAPGFEPQSGPLVPVQLGRALAAQAPHSQSPPLPSSLPSSRPKSESESVMDELVNQLAALDASTPSAGTSQVPPSSTNHVSPSSYPARYQ